MNDNERADILNGFIHKVDEDENWAYYHVGDGRGTLHRIRKDGMDLQRVMDAHCCEVNIVGDWIYHCRCDEEETLHKIRKDGAELTKLNDDYTREVRVYGDWIYYCADGMNLHKVRIDGTEKTKLNEAACRNIKVIGDWVYFGKLDDDHDMVDAIYRMRTDGTGRMKLGNADTYNWFRIEEEWIYYFIPSDDGYFEGKGDLCRMRLDGTEEAKLLENYHGYYHGSNIKIEGAWMYVLDEKDDTLFRMRIDGTDKSILAERCAYFKISGDWMYYSIQNPGYRGDTLHRIRKDGTDNKEIDILSSCYDFAASNDCVYYFNQNGIFKIRADSKNGLQICDDIIRCFEIIGDWVYFEKESDRGAFNRIHIDGWSREWFPSR